MQTMAPNEAQHIHNRFNQFVETKFVEVKFSANLVIVARHEVIVLGKITKHKNAICFLTNKLTSMYKLIKATGAIYVSDMRLLHANCSLTLEFGPFFWAIKRNHVPIWYMFLNRCCDSTLYHRIFILGLNERTNK